MNVTPRPPRLAERPKAVLGAPIPSLRLGTVSPDAARTLLSRVHPQLRQREECVRLYSRAMRDGCWVLNGDPLILTSGRQLLNGMQRLTACVETGIPFTTFIAEHVSEAAYSQIDQHQRRTFVGLLKENGFSSSMSLASLIQLLIRYDELTASPSPTAPPCWTWMVRCLASNSALRNAVAQAAMTTASALPAPVAAALLFMGHIADRDATNRLLAALQAPNSFEAGEPGVALRAQLDQLHQLKTREIDNETILFMVVRAFNATLSGRELRRLTEGRRSELPAWPKLEGYSGLPRDQSRPPTDTSAIRWDLERIDPDTASRYLAQRSGHRPASQGQVDAFAKDIASGAWLVTGQPLCFSAQGRLLDGQHRLLAIMAAGQAVESFVVRGLPEEASTTFDSAPRRSPVVFQAEQSFGDIALATAMANLLWRMELRAKEDRHRRANPAEIAEILRHHPRLMELRGFARKMVEYGRSSVMGYGAYVIERDDPALAAVFVQALSTGANLPPGHPVLTLRSQLQRLRRDHASQEDQLAALLTGWRRYKTQTASGRLERPPAAAGGQAFPGHRSPGKAGA